MNVLAYIALLKWLLEDGTELPKHVGGSDMCHKWYIEVNLLDNVLMGSTAYLLKSL